MENIEPQIAVREHSHDSGNMLPIIRAAIDQGVDPAKLEKMLELQERWEMSQAQKAFGAALAAFQAEMPQVHKSRKTTGGKFSFAFASLDDVMAVAQPLLAAHGISLAFDSTHTQSENRNIINVTLRIRVGAYYEDRKFGCPVPIDLSASQPQQWGAALSYAKRYALCAALNIIVTDEDTDAVNVVDTISATQMIELEKLIRETNTDVERFLKWARADSLDYIRRVDFEKVRAELLRKKGGAK